MQTFVGEADNAQEAVQKAYEKANYVLCERDTKSVFTTMNVTVDAPQFWYTFTLTICYE